MSRFRNLSFIIFLFLISFFSFNPNFSFAIDISTPPSQTITQTTPEPTNIFIRFFRSISNLFAKKYEINPNRSFDEKRQDETDYGDINKPIEFAKKHSYAGTRLTPNNNQDCRKGNIIKKAILGEKNELIAKICFNSSDPQTCLSKTKSTPSSDSLTCTEIKTSSLGYYFYQTNQKLYCNDNDQKIDTETYIINTLNQIFPNPIPSSELPCYQQIYNDFFLTPPLDPTNENDKNEENTKKIMKTPLPDKYQDPESDIDSLNTQTNQWVSPEGTNWGLSGLRPESEK